MLSSELKNILQDRFSERVSFNAPLAPHVAYKIGGPGDILLFPKSEEELEWIRSTATHNSLPVTVIGTGTNLLIRDGGIRGITVSLCQGFKNIELISDFNDEILVRVGAGVSKPELLEWAISKGFQGLEFSAGVPGTIGGGIFMNAGTKYGSYGDILKELRLFDFSRGAYTLFRDQVHFGYREQNAVKGSLVLSALFQLKKGNSETIRNEVNRIIAERAEKQPLDYPSCGSTFKNPEGFSAGRLIEKAGLKGLKRGGAEISLKHANFFLNKGGAKAADILELIQVVKDTVLQQFGVVLECEVIILGDNEPPEIQNKNRI